MKIVRNSAESVNFWQIPLSCGLIAESAVCEATLIEAVLPAGVEEGGGTDQDDEAEQDEAEGTDLAGGGLDGQVSGQKTVAVHFPDREAVVHQVGIGRGQPARHPDLVHHGVEKRSGQAALHSRYLFSPGLSMDSGRVSIGRTAAISDMAFLSASSPTGNISS